MRALFAVAALSCALCACSRDYVRVNDMALGRVVVYRNGVAYYERRATLDRDTLHIQVPRDKVNDFLKSLTVRDARTGAPLPVGFPSPGAEVGGMVNMVIELPSGSPTDLSLTYVTEAPAWKPSYRIMVARDGSVRLQGWAIVNNTSGEDWKNVVVGVGSSSALSFRYDLWSVRQIQRETLSSQQRLAVAPPEGSTPVSESTGGRTVALADDELPRPDSHPDAQDRKWRKVGGEDLDGDAGGAVGSVTGRAYGASLSGSAGAGKTGGVRRHRVAAAPRQEAQSRVAERTQWQEGKKKVAELAQSIRSNNNRWVIEGYADKSETDARGRALDRANLLRNQLIEEGVPPAQVQVRARGVVDGRAAGVRLVEQVGPVDSEAARAGHGAVAAGPVDDRPVGESHFESKTPMTVARHRSVMVSIVDRKTPGETVYLYDPESTRGSDRFAFKAIRFDNPSTSTLESGPVTVYDPGGFVGEGLTEPVPGKATAIVPFALDRQVVASHSQSTRDRITHLITLQRGVLTTEVAYVKQTEVSLTNRLDHPVTVYVRHTVEDGWTLGKAPKDVERVGDARLFRVELAARGTRKIDIEESTPMRRTIDLRSPDALQLVEVYLSQPIDDPGLAGPMKHLLALNHEMADQQEAIDGMRQRLGDYRVRMNELHAQIVTLQAVKSGGALMRQLKQKMSEISDRVQKSTLELVDREEKLMLARIKFQDAVAELTLTGTGTGDKGEARATAEIGAGAGSPRPAHGR